MVYVKDFVLFKEFLKVNFFGNLMNFMGGIGKEMKFFKFFIGIKRLKFFY